ncbi:MAG TPA: antibiotic biosynthesis monooxygenase [Sphingobium sp.]|nr:antibiotic biosynthesis monooxygenase [Sphingobium sp.]
MWNGVIITIEVVVEADMAETLANALPARLGDLSLVQGFHSARIIRHKLEANRFMIIEHWDSETDFEIYQTWRSERQEIPGEEALLSYDYDAWVNVEGSPAF